MFAFRMPIRAFIGFQRGVDEEALVMLSDILPTGFECGVLNGKIAPGATVAIVGSGPIGLAALLTAQFYSPSQLIMMDLDDNRLEVARRLGATSIINSSDGKAAAKVMALTEGRGVDCAIEAVGIPAILPAVRGHRCTRRHDREYRRPWRQGRPASRALVVTEISITTRLVDTVTTPMLLKTVSSGKLEPKKLITHHFKLDEIIDAYDTFGRAAETRALKVIIGV